MGDEERRSQRIENEIAAGKAWRDDGAWQIYESPAGQIGWKRRVDFLTEHLRPGMDVLEVGCGTGILTVDLVPTGAKIIAVDISPELVEASRVRIKADNVEFRVANAFDLDFESDAFDHIVGSSVLHHLEVEGALSEFRRVLKPGGTLRLSEPNMVNPQIFLQKNIPYLKRLSGDTPDETAFVRWSLQRKMKKCGFVDVSARPYNFLHPLIPTAALPVLRPVCDVLERIPLLSEFAGSLMIQGTVRQAAAPAGGPR